MATSMHTQPSTVARQPVSPSYPVDPEPEARLAEEAIPYKGPSHRDYKGRFRLMMMVLGLLFAVTAALLVRVLTEGGAGEAGEKLDPGAKTAPAQTPSP